MSSERIRWQLVNVLTLNRDERRPETELCGVQSTVDNGRRTDSRCTTDGDYAGRPIRPHVDRCVVDNWQQVTCWWRPSTERQYDHMLHHARVTNQLIAYRSVPLASLEVAPTTLQCYTIQ